MSPNKAYSTNRAGFLERELGEHRFVFVVETGGGPNSPWNTERSARPQYRSAGGKGGAEDGFSCISPTGAGQPVRAKTRLINGSRPIDRLP